MGMRLASMVATPIRQLKEAQSIFKIRVIVQRERYPLTRLQVTCSQFTYVRRDCSLNVSTQRTYALQRSHIEPRGHGGTSAHGVVGIQS